MKKRFCGSSVVVSGLVLSLAACSGGSGGAGNTGGGGSGGGGTGGTPATSGEYLLEFPNTGSNLSYAAANSTTGALGPVTIAGHPIFNSADYPTFVVTPSNKYLYALDASNNELVSFQVEGPGFQLAQMQNNAWNLTEPIQSIALDPSGKHLYLIQSPAIVQEFTSDPNTGVLTKGAATTENADFRLGVFDSSGQFLYVIDLTGGRIFAYQISQTIGSLAAVAGSPFKVPASGQPESELINGGFLYTELLSGGVAAFSINGSSGALTVVPGSPFATSSATPAAMCADPSGRFLYASNFLTNGMIDGFAINATTGALTPVAGSPFATGTFPGSVAIDASGRFVYVSSYQASMIYGYALDSSTGSLSALAGSPFPAVANPRSIAAIQIP